METIFIHKSSYIDDDVIIGEGTKIWHFCHIQKGARIGKNCSIGQNVNIGNNVIIGDNVKIQNNVSVYEGVTIEDDVFLGPSCVFTNDLTPRAKYPKGKENYKKTIIKKGASIGANATIVCGVIIGENAMIGAGSVVTKDISKCKLAYGNPAVEKSIIDEKGNKYNMMQFRDLKKQYEILKNNIDENIQKVLNDTNFIMGFQVEELENKLANYVGRKHCIGVANGTDALILSLMVLGIGKGDAVFVPDFTYIASASCVSAVGATPIFVDIDLKTFNMSSESLSKMIEKIKKENNLKLKAIIPVDLFGLPADYNNILKIAKDNNLLVIEDAAQGFGGRIGNDLACSFGDISCTSFFPAKPLGCYGDGGAIFTDDDKIDEMLRSMRANGKSKIDKYDNIMIGRNSRLDTIQAAVLLAKFDAFVNIELDSINNIASIYDKELNQNYIVPYIPENFYSSYAQYTILIKDENKRNELQNKLKNKNIPTMIYYPKAMHEQKCFEYLDIDVREYTNSIEATKKVLSIPIHPYLTKDDINYIINNINYP